ncbi:MAG: hypothetical protein AB8D78_03690 [Akkermansiaceae bacterium]
MSGISALLRLEDSSTFQAIVFKGSSSRGLRNGLVVSKTPPSAESAAIAFSRYGQLQTAPAKRIATLDSGLSLYEFQTQSSLSDLALNDPAPDTAFHVIRLKEAEMTQEDGRAKLEEELKQIQERLAILKDTISTQLETSRELQQIPPQDRRQAGRQLLEHRRELARLQAEQRRLRQREGEIEAALPFPVKNLICEEVAAAPDLGALEANNKALENTFLVSSGQSIHAIRADGKWIYFKDIIEASAKEISEVSLKLSGNQNNLTLNMEIFPTLPLGIGKFSMIAASTFELESQPGSSIEERLASIKSSSLRNSSDKFYSTKNLRWNGQPCKVWIKVFRDEEPDKPIIDEVINISYTDGFNASWAKPPSPIIKIPATKPNTPENLVSSETTIDAKSQIIDMVAAGDGSTLLVRTKEEPYWAPLDLKTGKWLTKQWDATPSTLIASQAGKLYLLNRETKILEIRDLKTGNRTGLELLPVDGEIVSIAAPLENLAMPLIVATTKNIHFLDPIRFEPVPSGLDLSNHFSFPGDETSRNVIDPSSIWVRASGDGTLYTICGKTADSSRSPGRPIGVRLTLDPSGLIVQRSSNSWNLATRGRFSTDRTFPDHGGQRITATPSRSGGSFPEPTGKFLFKQVGDREAIAELASAPAVPSQAIPSVGSLMPDRYCYFDSKAGVFLLPQDHSLKLLRLDFPETTESLPPFVISGESIKLPLPSGTDHKTVLSSEKSTAVVENGLVIWYPKTTSQLENQTLKLEWQGELGSKMSKDYRINVFPDNRSFEISFPDGSKRFPLPLRGILPDSQYRIEGYAGSGAVGYSKSSLELKVWNLLTCELLFERKVRPKQVLGDADFIYIRDYEDNLTSLDPQTGEVVAETKISKEVQQIATGMSSRSPLVAVEHQRTLGVMLFIDRKTLDSRILDLEPSIRQKLFIPQMQSNSSASAIWTRGLAIFRDDKATTFKDMRPNFAPLVHKCNPDETGKYVVSIHSVIDVTTNPPTEVKINNNDETMGLDHSGRYLMIWKRAPSDGKYNISVRAIKEPKTVLFNIHLGSNRPNGLALISATNTLLLPRSMNARSKTFVYDLDIPKILSNLSQ